MQWTHVVDQEGQAVIAFDAVEWNRARKVGMGQRFVQMWLGYDKTRRAEQTIDRKSVSKNTKVDIVPLPR